MFTFKNILYPTDFSFGSEKALIYASELAMRYGATLHIINIMEGKSSKTPTDEYSETDKKLRKWPDYIVKHDGPIVRNVIDGVAKKEIIKYADKNSIDLIVMGTHGYTGLERTLLGSVAEYVVRNSSCPVMTVHSHNL